MISYAQFHALRLHQYMPEADIDQLTDWEFEDRLWVGEAVGFSEWLRLEEEPEQLRSLSLAFAELPDTVTMRVLHVLMLPIRPGMPIEELQAILGEPRKVYTFVHDRTTYDFTLGKGELYYVSCTVLLNGGLTYLVVMTQLPPKLANDDEEDEEDV